MMKKKRRTGSSIYETFSDLALMALGTFIFLFVTIVITSQLSQRNEVPQLKKQLAMLEEQLKLSQADKNRFKKDLEKVIITDPETQTNTILEAAGTNRKDFELFIQGLKNIPGKDIHLVIDATGSMHGVSAFLIPILRLIVSRADKQVSAITWYSDNRFETYTGTMGDMFDHLVAGAPFTGSIEYIGRAFVHAEENAPRPGAYLLVGDEPSDDTVMYSEIPSPVFTLPLGLSDPDTERDFGIIAEKTGGKKLHLDLR
jgi:hypothetical protein